MVETSKQQSDSIPQTTAGSENDIFISYSRKDKAFVSELDAAFRRAKRDPWVDWDDIRKGEDWWKSIQQGIEAADTFIFVLSPDSVASDVCRQEIDYATQHNKRFLPLVHRESFDMQRVHPSIARHNWLFFRETDDFDAAFAELAQAIDTDLDYVRAHTRLLVRSLEWQEHQQDSSYLLRGNDLNNARDWLKQSLKNEPKPTNLQIAYIEACAQARLATLRAQQRTKWVVVLTTVVANFALVSAGLWWLYCITINAAQQNVEQEMFDTLEGAIAGIDGNEFEALSELARDANQPPPVNDSLYLQHQQWLTTIRQIEPQSRTTTYTFSDRDNEIVIIGDALRAELPKDAHAFGETIPPHTPEMMKGLQSRSQELYSFENDAGIWVTAAYGPILGSTGDSVGAIALEYDVAYVYDVRDQIDYAMKIGCVVSLVWVILSSYIILKVTPKELP